MPDTTSNTPPSSISTDEPDRQENSSSEPLPPETPSSATPPDTTSIHSTLEGPPSPETSASQAISIETNSLTNRPEQDAGPQPTGPLKAGIESPEAAPEAPTFQLTGQVEEHPKNPPLVSEEVAIAAAETWKHSPHRDDQKRAYEILSTYDRQRKEQGLETYPKYKKKRRESFDLATRGMTDDMGDPATYEKVLEMTGHDEREAARFATVRFFANLTGMSIPETTSRLDVLMKLYSIDVFNEPITDILLFRRKVGDDIRFRQKEIVDAARVAAVRGYDPMTAHAYLHKQFGTNPVFQGREKMWNQTFDLYYDEVSSKITPDERELLYFTADQLKKKTGVEKKDSKRATSGRRKNIDIEPESYKELTARWLEIPEDRIALLLGNIDAFVEGEVNKEYIQKLAENFGRGVQELGYGAVDAVKRMGLQGELGTLEAEQFLNEKSDDPQTEKVRQKLLRMAPRDTVRTEEELAILESIDDPRIRTKIESMMPRVTGHDSPEERAKKIERIRQEQKALNLHHKLRTIAEQVIDPARHDGLIGQGVLDAAHSLPYTLTAMIPYGGGLLINSLALSDQAFHTLKAANPDFTDEQANAISVWAGPLMALMEKVPAAVLKGKAPTVLQWGNRYLYLPKAQGLSTAIRFGDRAVSGSLIEYATEMGQNMTPYVIGEFAHALQQDFPNLEVGAIFNEQIRQSPELFAAIVPLVLFGAGVGGVREQHTARNTMKSEALLRAVGIPRDVAADISHLAQSNQWYAAESTFRESLQQVGKDGRSIEQIHNEGVEGANQANEEIREAIANIDLLESLKIVPSLMESKTGWTMLSEIADKDGNHVEIDSAHYKTYEEAKAAQSRLLEHRQIELTEDTHRLLSHLEETQGRGVRSRYILHDEQRTVDQELAEGIVSKENIDLRLEEANRERIEGSVTTEEQAPIPDLETARQETEQAFQRANASALAAAETRADRDFIATIVGRSRSEFVEGVWVRTTDFYHGATLATVIEETAEADAGLVIAKHGTAFLTNKLRRFEQASGISLFTRQNGDPNEFEVKEAFSKLVRSYLLTRADDLGQVGQDYRNLFRHVSITCNQ